MERFMIDRCDFCMHRNGLLCSVSHRDCKPGLEPCPYDSDHMYPCKYATNDNVRRFLESQGVRVELRDGSTTEDDIKEARRVVEECIEENVQEAKRAIYKVTEESEDGAFTLELIEDPKLLEEIIEEEQQSRISKFIGMCKNIGIRIKKLFKK